MKIGILTFHCAHNYGAVLQCYALQQYLRSLGHDILVVNYQPKYLLEPYSIVPNLKVTSFIRWTKVLLKFILTLPIRIMRYRKFEKFINEYLRLTSEVKDVKDIASLNCDVYIMGSDQIWNPRITEGFDSVYFGGFEVGRDVKKIAYGASLGLQNLTKEQCQYLAKSLSNFNAISVREYKTISLLQPLTNLSISQVVDPTFLLEEKDWNNLASKVPLCKEKYVLTYQVEVNPNVNRIACLIARQLNARLIRLVAWPTRNYSRELKQVVDPAEFLSYFRHAECVVTSSFHGTAFSILYRRPFYVVDLHSLRGGSNERLKTLLSLFHLEERYIPEEWNAVFQKIDYTDINTQLESVRGESQKFLLDNLK